MDVYCEDVDYALLKPWNVCIGSSLSPPSPSMWGWGGRPGKQGRKSQTFLCDQHPPPLGGGVYLGLGLIFAGYVPLAPQNPYPIIVYSAAIIIIDLILVTLGKK